MVEAEDPVQACEAIAAELAERHAAFFAANPKSGIVQHCVIFKGDGEAVSVVCGWDSAGQRAATLAALRLFMAASGATRYAVCSEVWIVMVPAPDAKTREEAEAALGENYKPGDIAKNPAREECVFTLVVDASGVMANRLQKIVRDKRGRVAALEPLPSQEGIGGALADLLPPRKLH